MFGGALGVGIGLGLQKLASNYIAGFTILLDRSIRLGDMITVDGRHGIVSSVTSRYVVVKSLDGIEAIVPNETLVTTTVLNYTYTSKNSRVAVAVQVSYDSDVDLALELMTAAGNAHVRVLKSPSPPAAFVVRFAESGIELELGVWIATPRPDRATCAARCTGRSLRRSASTGSGSRTRSASSVSSIRAKSAPRQLPRRRPRSPPGTRQAGARNWLFHNANKPAPDSLPDLASGYNGLPQKTGSGVTSPTVALIHSCPSISCRSPRTA